MPTDEAIDRDSFMPAYYQLAQILERKIKSGELEPGSLIPSEAELSEAFGISRVTVRKGIALLVEAGLLDPVQGKGTFVAVPRLDRATFAVSRFEEEFRRRGIECETRLIEARVTAASLDLAGKLEAGPGTKVLLIKRLFLVEREPVGYEKKHLLYEKGQPILEAEIGYSPFPDLVAKHSSGVPTRNRVAVYAVALDEEGAEVLGIDPGLPVFRIEETIYTNGDRPAGWGYAVYRGDKYYMTSISEPRRISPSV